MTEAEERRRQGLKQLPVLQGFDIEQRAIGTARANARRAGLAGRIVFERRPLAALVAPTLSGTSETDGAAVPPSVAGGLVVTNPPYGKRLGEVEELVEVYETLGERLKAGFSGWEAAVFTGNPQLGAHLGLRAHRVNVLYNGPLECRLLLFHIGERAGGAIPAPAARETPSRLFRGDSAPGADHSFGVPSGSHDLASRLGDARVQNPLAAGAVMFSNRLSKNLKHLRRWAAREGVHCYRVYDADLPEYAVAVDLYDDWAHVQEYAPPGTVDPVRARRRLKEVVAVVPEALEIPPGHVVLKVRRPQRGADQYQRLGEEGRFLEVAEGGLRFQVNLTDYLDTGLFLDHRPTRQLIRELAPGRRFLNLFAYTGSATVYAAAGGAPSTTTVDMSSTYLDWARRNLSLNGFSGIEPRLRPGRLPRVAGAGRRRQRGRRLRPHLLGCPHLLQLQEHDHHTRYPA